MGRVVFIGAGPGAADLITVRGAARLAQADVVLSDALTDPALRELAPRARWIQVGKRGFSHGTTQATINALLVKHAAESALVVRLKGGDPSLFGRLEEEIATLARAGIACEVVPGVTAALAAAAATQRPLTRRGTHGSAGRSVSLTTAVTQSGALHATRTADTEVFYMAGQQLAALSRRLLVAGWPASTPVSVVSRAGCADMRTATTICRPWPTRAFFMRDGRPWSPSARAQQHWSRPHRRQGRPPGRPERRSPGLKIRPFTKTVRHPQRCGAAPRQPLQADPYDPRRPRIVHPLQVHRSVDVCPVDCFREGPNFLTIDPDECIDCAVCIPECPVNAIVPEEDVPADQQPFIKLNADLAPGWPSITKRKAPLPDADEWKDRMGKLSELNR